ncbi:unnamed protein product [Trichogramma brassicae]|uniref:Uncharacterized protein n=1 Tax=Trichogramma brassicae TaxID=86971 RepID=A0A6H5J0Z6_9HYME|nr:unnamed protein product [Trichogramma brassicae]
MEVLCSIYCQLYYACQRKKLISTAVPSLKLPGQPSDKEKSSKRKRESSCLVNGDDDAVIKISKSDTMEQNSSQVLSECNEDSAIISEQILDLSAIPSFPTPMSTGHFKDARQEPPPSTITFQEYVAAAKELHLHQRILLHLADRRLRSYLRAAPMPPPSPEQSAPASTLQTTAQPADPSGSAPPVWRLIRLDTPPPPRTPRLDPRFRNSDPRRFRVPLNVAQTPPLPSEIEREQRRKATPSTGLIFSQASTASEQRTEEASTDETFPTTHSVIF